MNEHESKYVWTLRSFVPPEKNLNGDTLHRYQYLFDITRLCYVCNACTCFSRKTYYLPKVTLLNAATECPRILNTMCYVGCWSDTSWYGKCKCFLRSPLELMYEQGGTSLLKTLVRPFSDDVMENAWRGTACKCPLYRSNRCNARRSIQV